MISLAAFAAALSADDRPMAFEKLPVAAKEYIQTNFPGEKTTMVTKDDDLIFADYTVMLMIMAMRHMNEIMMRNAVQDYTLKGLIGRELKDMTVGIIGTGRIGQTVMRNLSGFGCKILCYDIYPSEAAAALGEYVSLESLMVISSYTQATHIYKITL